MYEEELSAEMMMTGYAFDPLVLVHDGEHFEAIHFGHHDVEQHEGDIELVLFELRDGLQSVLRLL